MAYPGEALTAVCKLLLDVWELSQDDIANLALDIADECEGIREMRAEAAWQERQEELAASGGPDDSQYRRDMIAAGRGRLLP